MPKTALELVIRAGNIASESADLTSAPLSSIGMVMAPPNWTGGSIVVQISPAGDGVRFCDLSDAVLSMQPGTAVSLSAPIELPPSYVRLRCNEPLEQDCTFVLALI